MKKYLYIFVVCCFFSCEYLGIEKKDTVQDQPIATVFGNQLYRKDIANLFPKNISKEDSIVIAKGFINSWATQQLLLKKAEENITQANNSEINKLVSDYRQGLLINGYKERLIKQQLDTVVSNESIENYYKANNNNFRLNEDLLQLRYIHYGKDLLDKKEVEKQFKSDKIEDLELLEEKQLSFKSMMLNDSIWTPLDNVMLNLPFSKEELLKNTQLLRKEDSLGLYLVAVKKVLQRNDIAPLSYVKPTVKQLILHKRKLELIREIEKIIIQDAIQNKSFKIY